MIVTKLWPSRRVFVFFEATTAVCLDLAVKNDSFPHFHKCHGSYFCVFPSKLTDKVDVLLVIFYCDKMSFS